LYRFIAFNNAYHKNFVSKFFETLKYKFHGIICWRKMDVKLILNCVRALYGGLHWWAGSLLQCGPTAEIKYYFHSLYSEPPSPSLPFPMPTSTYYPALGSSSPHSPSSPHDRCALSFPFHHIAASRFHHVAATRICRHRSCLGLGGMNPRGGSVSVQF
jgi:hypothetical protein